MKPLKHQEKFISGYKDKALLVHEGGTGKTICACLWLKDNRDFDALVVCPKKVVKKWQKTLTDWNTKATVISKDDFKKNPYYWTHPWSAKVIDEADEFASPLFVAKQRSKLSETMYTLTKNYPDMPTLLLTATPIRSNPYNLHTLLIYIGVYIEYQKWREHFFDLKRMPYLPMPAYIPKKEWRIDIRHTLEKYADIVLMKDVVELPKYTEEQIIVTTPKYIKQLDDKPFFSEHRWEQQNKVKEIIEIGIEYRKILVVAYYKEQLIELEKQLSKERQVFMINGDVKNQEDVIKQAQDSDECYFIVQAGLGAGFDADTFSCVVFTSMSYAVRDFVQMKWRVTRVHNLHKVKYIFLIGGKCDKAILANIEAGKDFVPSEYLKYDTTRITQKV